MKYFPHGNPEIGGLIILVEVVYQPLCLRQAPCCWNESEVFLRSARLDPTCKPQISCLKYVVKDTAVFCCNIIKLRNEQLILHTFPRYRMKAGREQDFSLVFCFSSYVRVFSLSQALESISQIKCTLKKMF